jgi:hypothetical protein
MAQTKRKRRTKHRGNAAGMIEVRGRTSKSAGTTGKGSGRGTGPGGKAVRTDRWDKPPTWQAAANRAGIATVIFVVLVLFVFKQPVAAALGLGAFMMVLYVPLGFYTDRALYRRRQRQRAGKPKA